MLKKTLTMSALTGVLVFGAGLALADDQDRTRLQDRDQTKTKAQDQDRVFGSQLMTKQERNEYRNRMRAAKTPQEREQIRAEHHERMLVRAKERGVTLPDDPPARGGSFRSGAGMGPGGAMAPGGGMGPGGKR
ncbi:MAG: hypothetical protein NUV63_13165 [Gallionella sp.]|nr:hypothetical protein [Gallionella sp.]